jgi:hypothetical protein
MSIQKAAMVTILSLTVVGGVLAIPAITDLIKSKNNTSLVGMSRSQIFPDVALVIMQNGMKSMSSAISGTLQKQTGAFKETTQAELNYKASAETADGAFQAAEKYSSPEVMANTCDVAEDQSASMNSKISADLWTKAIVATNLERSLSSKSEGESMRRVLDTHFSLYCSDADAIRDRCAAMGGGMPDADINVGTFFTPNSENTLSQQEYNASLAASRNIINAVPFPNLPQSFENTSSGQVYLVQKRSNEAVLSLSDHAMARIIANRRSQEDQIIP